MDMTMERPSEAKFNGSNAMPLLKLATASLNFAERNMLRSAVLTATLPTNVAKALEMEVMKRAEVSVFVVDVAADAPVPEDFLPAGDKLAFKVQDNKGSMDPVMIYVRRAGK